MVSINQIFFGHFAGLPYKMADFYLYAFQTIITNIILSK